MFNIVDLVSKCKGGKQATAKVYVVGPAGGLGIKGMPPIVGTFAQLELKDDSPVADPNWLNGEYKYLAADFTPGVGYSCGILVVGKAGTIGCDWEYGFGVGGTVAVGSSTVMQSHVWDCPCEDKE